MLVPMQLTIVGVQPSKFKFNDYEEDTTKVYALLPLSESNGGRGQSSQAFNYKTSNDIKEFDGLQFPLTADCQVEMITTGKKTSLILKQVSVVKPTK